MEVQGFEMMNAASSQTNTMAIGRGVCIPMWESGGSGTLASYSNAENKEIRLLDTGGLSANFEKRINATWEAGDDKGGLASGESIPSGGVLYVFVMGRSNDDAFEVGFDTNINGSNLADDTAIKLWHDNAGGQKLFLRRVRTVLMQASATTLVAQHTYGNWTHFRTPIQSFTASSMGNSEQTGTINTPGERCMVDLLIVCTQAAASTNFSIWSDMLGSSKVVIAKPSLATAAEVAYATVSMELDPGFSNMHFECDKAGAHSMSGKMLRWYDPRGYVPTSD
jgi:hypothetical protein